MPFGSKGERGSIVWAAQGEGPSDDGSAEVPSARPYAPTEDAG